MSSTQLSGSRRLADPGNKTEVTVVIPCYNEEESVPRLKEALLDCEQQLRDRYLMRFLFVDDGSTDNTLRDLRNAFGETPNCSIARHVENCGIAAAIMTGIREASTEIVASIDSDCTYEPIQLESMLSLMDDETDLVTASPYHPDGAVVNLPKWRLAISWLASFIYGCVMGLRVHTYTSCFRIYRRSSVSSVKLQNSGFTGVPELLWRVDQAGGRVVECPAILKAREQGQSKMRIVYVSLRHFRLLARILTSRVLRLQPRTRLSRTGGSVRT